VKISDAETWSERVPLKRPYTIASSGLHDDVELAFVRVVAGDAEGFGCASPGPAVTGETGAACRAALEAVVPSLRGEDPRRVGTLVAAVSEGLAATPAARAAVDMALHDLFAALLGVPLVDVLGRCHTALPTSITIGIKDEDETLAEACEYLARGFRHLKIKIGADLDADVARLQRLRAEVGTGVSIRVDANQGYALGQVEDFHRRVAALDLELVEQPFAASDVEGARSLAAAVRATVALDESLHSPADAWLYSRAPAPAGIYNIKLMKCGGIAPGRAIARVAGHAGIALMWGCMDESVISIAAALHAAFASPATRYLDLDGSLDLARDPFAGGFVIDDGVMRTTDAPGLGVRRVSP